MLLQMTLFHFPYFTIHFSINVNGHLCSFYILTIVNSAAVNTGVHVSFSIMVFSGCMPSSGVVGLLGQMEFYFWF